MGKRFTEISQNDAEEAIFDYNSGKDSFGKKNVDVDKEARAIFDGGLGQTLDEIKHQVEFIGNNYEGLKYFKNNEGHKISLKISKAIYNFRNVFTSSIKKYDNYEALDINYIWDDIFYPFSKGNIGGKNDYKVWATKFWHFLNPSTFPIMDSRSVYFYAIDHIKCKKFQYNSCLRIIKWILVRNILELNLMKLHRFDNEHFTSYLKLIDKIAYQLGRKNTDIK